MTVYVQTMLGLTARYRLIERLGGGLVIVEVIEAPGLDKGQLIKMTSKALAAMRPERS